MKCVRITEYTNVLNTNKCVRVSKCVRICIKDEINMAIIEGGKEWPEIARKTSINFDC